MNQFLAMSFPFFVPTAAQLRRVHRVTITALLSCYYPHNVARASENHP